MKTRNAILLIVPVLMLRTLCLWGQVTADNAVLDAVRLYEEGNYETAGKKLQAVLASYPQNDAACYYLGLCNFSLQDFEEAEIFLKRASELDPDNYWYKDRLAALYNATGQTELTIDIYEKLLEEYPRKIEICYNLVNLYAKQGRSEDVLRTLDAIETVTGRDETVAMARYDMLMQMQKPQEALESLQDYNAEFTSPQVLSLMGDFHLSQYEDSLALECYCEALECQPDCAPALVGRSEVYRMKRDYLRYFSSLRDFVSEEAVSAQMKAQYLSTMLQHADLRFVQNFRDNMDTLAELSIARHGTDSLILQTAATYYLSTDRHSRAREILDRNRKIHMESVSAAAMYIQALAFGGEWEEVAEESEKAYFAFPGELEFLSMEVLAHYNRKDYPAVIAVNERMIAAAPADSAVLLQSYSSMGDIYHLMGESRKAYAAYEKALKVNPSYAPVLNNYAYYLSLGGRKLKKAYAMSKLTVEQEPDNATYLDTYAWILHLQGRSSEAKSYFKHAILYGGKDSATVLEHYAAVLESLGEADLAKFYRDMASTRPKDE